MSFRDARNIDEWAEEFQDLEFSKNQSLTSNQWYGTELVVAGVHEPEFLNQEP